MSIDRVVSLAPLSGIVAVILVVLGYAVAGTIAYRPSGDAASALFTADPDRIQLGALIGGYYALVFLVIFVGSVASAVRRAESDPRLAYIAMVGGIVAVVALALGFRSLNAAAFQASVGDGIGPEMATVMFRLFTSSFAGFVSFGLAAFVGATGVAALHTGMLPRWIGWVGVVSAVGLMTPAHGVFEMVVVLWIVAVSYLLYRVGEGGARATPV